MKLTPAEQTYKTFGEMTRDEQIELVTAFYVDGEVFESRGLDGNWNTYTRASIHGRYYYRLANQPKPKQGATIEFTHDELVKYKNMMYAEDTCHQLRAIINMHLAGEPQ